MPFSVPNLALVIDRRLYRVHSEDAAPLSLVEAAIEGGITMVQLRLGDGGDRHIVGGDDLAANAVAQRLREMTAGRVPFLVTGDIELADRCRADGVVLVGDKTYRPDHARDYLHANAIVGCYVDTLRAAAIAEHGGADFVQFGPIFDNDGKENLSLIRKIKDAVNVSLVAYGGMDTLDKVKMAVDAGADGVAVTNTILDAPDPISATRELRAAIG